MCAARRRSATYRRTSPGNLRTFLEKSMTSHVNNSETDYLVVDAVKDVNLLRRELKNHISRQKTIFMCKESNPLLDSDSDGCL